MILNPSFSGSPFRVCVMAFYFWLNLLIWHNMNDTINPRRGLVKEYYPQSRRVASPFFAYFQWCTVHLAIWLHIQYMQTFKTTGVHAGSLYYSFFHYKRIMCYSKDPWSVKQCIQMSCLFLNLSTISPQAPWWQLKINGIHGETKWGEKSFVAKSDKSEQKMTINVLNKTTGNIY